ncbi:MAG: stage 0 sporulation family protein [Dehalococcoidia bacterium]|nr:stage 0 sporulation family protein [Dehalococcoidia bacterium]
MPEIVGVRFQPTTKLYYFDPAGIALKAGDRVVVETVHGLELGQVVIAPAEVLPEEFEKKKPVKVVLRKAEEKDVQQAARWKGQEEAALLECRRRATKLGLPMKVASVEYNLDGSHLTVSFGSDTKVDFRELLHEMARDLRTRIQFRQVGPREETKTLGGMGRCGRGLCCSTFLTQFDPVSIKMAKEQDLPLNPAKISGVCGRLLCCLAYENEFYRASKSVMPKVGQKVATESGEGHVIHLNVLKGNVVVELESRATVELPAAEVKVLEQAPIFRRQKGKRPNPVGAPARGQSQGNPAAPAATGQSPGNPAAPA